MIIVKITVFAVGYLDHNPLNSVVFLGITPLNKPWWSLSVRISLSCWLTWPTVCHCMTDMFGAIYTISCQHTDDVFVSFFSSSCSSRFCHNQSSASINLSSASSSLATSINLPFAPPLGLFAWQFLPSEDIPYIMYTTHICMLRNTSLLSFLWYAQTISAWHLWLHPQHI